MKLRKKDSDVVNDMNKTLNIDIKKILVIMAIIFFLVFAIFIVINVFVNHHNNQAKLKTTKIMVDTLRPDVLNKKTIRDYMKESNKLESYVIENINKKNVSSNDFNNSSLEIDDHIKTLKKCCKNINDNIEEMKKLKSPPETEKLNKLLIKQYSIYLEGLKLEIKYMETKKENLLESAKNNYNIFTELHDQSIKELQSLKSKFNK